MFGFETLRPAPKSFFFLCIAGDMMALGEIRWMVGQQRRMAFHVQCWLLLQTGAGSRLERCQAREGWECDHRKPEIAVSWPIPLWGAGGVWERRASRRLMSAVRQ